MNIHSPFLDFTLPCYTLMAGRGRSERRWPVSLTEAVHTVYTGAVVLGAPTLHCASHAAIPRQSRERERFIQPARKYPQPGQDYTVL